MRQMISTQKPSATDVMIEGGRRVVRYFQEDPDRVVGWGMMAVAFIGQYYFGIFW